MISTPFWYIAAAKAFPLAGSANEAAYFVSTVISLPNSFAASATPFSKPAWKRSITTPSSPPTKPTLFVFVSFAAATPAK